MGEDIPREGAVTWGLGGQGRVLARLGWLRSRKLEQESEREQRRKGARGHLGLPLQGTYYDGRKRPQRLWSLQSSRTGSLQCSPLHSSWRRLVSCSPFPADHLATGSCLTLSEIERAGQESPCGGRGIHRQADAAHAHEIVCSAPVSLSSGSPLFL